jgi:hypothetical protein
VHKPWGAFSYYLEHRFGLIIIYLLNLFFGSFDCFLHLLEIYQSCYLIVFAIFYPQYSLVSFKYLPLYMCMCFHLFLLDMHTVLEELSLYWPSKFFRPFWQWMPMGEKFQGF